MWRMSTAEAILAVLVALSYSAIKKISTFV
jgi:hypothetical protein